VGLLERFYTPVGGQILLDSHDIQTLDPKWLRRQMSLVNQEPVLFNCTIRRNIEYGLIGTEFESLSEEKTSELVDEATKMANAHEFISQLPSGYETVAGDRGVLLSGGQKQRIAIARAIISDPKILLLDEATSALDSRSEGLVQAALDIASRGRTTIVVAHRLSTIAKADNIVVMAQGRIVEQGAHHELIERRGVYFDLVEAQSLVSGKNTGVDDVKESTADDFAADVQSVTDPTSTKILQDLDAEHIDSLWTIIKFILSFNRPELGIMIFGLICSILAGGGMPVQGLLFAKCIVSLSLPDHGQLRSDINFWSLMFLVVGIAIFVLSIGHGTAFAYCSERL
jgi:ATP-binding cassette subfamily B (MDR/TAP) protein 1